MSTGEPKRQSAEAAGDPANQPELEVETVADLDVPERDAEELRGGIVTRKAGGGPPE